MNKPNILAPTLATTLATALIISSTVCTVSFADDNTIVVTANQMQQNIGDTLTDIEVIDREDIERIQPQSFIDLLVNVAGIDVVQKGGQGQDSSIFARGSNSNQLLILIDGVRVGSATLGIKSIANISISQIERIEIVKGPRAALWGSDAIGGVLQIFTRRLSTGEHKLALTFGSDATAAVDAAIGFGSDELTNTLTYSHQQTDGIDAHIDSETDKDGYKNDSLALRGNYLLTKAAVIDWLAQVDEGETEFDTAWGGNIISHNNYLWHLRYSHQSADWNNQFSVNNSRDQSFSFGNGVEKSNASIFETRRQQFRFLTRKDINDNISLGGGVDWLIDDVAKSTTSYAISERTTKSAHLNGLYTNDSILAEFAVRYDDVQNIATNTSINIGVGYRFSPLHQLSLNYGEGFKAPTFNDLYFPFGGNPDLEFETSENTEIVYKGFFDSASLVISVYDSTVDNLIQWIPDSNGIWAPQNIGKADISGIDASLKINHGQFSHKLTASYINSEDATTNSQLPLRAKQQFGYELSYLYDAIDIFSQLQYVGERPDTDFQTYSATMLNSYAQVNLGASYTFGDKKQWQLKLKISDVFDESPTLVSGYNSAGRKFYLTLVNQNIF